MSTSTFYFRHLNKATVNPIEGKLTGTIPAWLEGTLIRNGSGIFEFGPDRYNHLFDGLSVLHRMHISKGKATYSNRPLESDTYKTNAAAGRIVVSQFGTAVTSDPCHAHLSSYKTEFEEIEMGGGTDTCAVNVAYYGDQLFALTESAQTMRIDPGTLLPIGPKTVISDYIAINSGSAHPHVLPDGTVINMGHHYSNKTGSNYAFFEVPPKFNSKENVYSDAKMLCEIPVTHDKSPAYLHSFGIVNDLVVIAEHAFRIDLTKVKSALENDGTSYLDSHDWHEGQKTRFIIASMKTGAVHPIIYETDHLFTFHHSNTYEENGHLVVDLSGYDTAKYVKENMIRTNMNTKFKSNPGSSLRRYVLPLKVEEGATGNLVTLKNTTASATLRAGTNGSIVDVKPQILFNGYFEFPKYNYKFNGLKYRYNYAVSFSQKSAEAVDGFPDPDLLVKVDAESGEAFFWTEENAIPSEPIFVSNPTISNPDEDDGVVLVPLLHKDDLQKITLLIVDAKNWKEIARTEFKAEGTVTTTFHGQWANTADKIHLY